MISATGGCNQVVIQSNTQMQPPPQNNHNRGATTFVDVKSILSQAVNSVWVLLPQVTNAAGLYKLTLHLHYFIEAIRQNQERLS